MPWNFYNEAEHSSPKYSEAPTIITSFGCSTSYSARWRQRNLPHRGQLISTVCCHLSDCNRNVSAEIFVVCQDFLAPKSIDPKFLDPKHVFKDLAASISEGGLDKGASANNVQSNVFHPEKQRRKRDGYQEGDYTLFKAIPVSDFIKGTDPVAVLGLVNQLTFNTVEEKECVSHAPSEYFLTPRCRWSRLDITKPDIKINCDDLKVLGKSDFKALMKWRLAVREEVTNRCTTTVMPCLLPTSDRIRHEA